MSACAVSFSRKAASFHKVCTRTEPISFPEEPSANTHFSTAGCQSAISPEVPDPRPNLLNRLVDHRADLDLRHSRSP